MSERFKELLANSQRWLREAVIEWAASAQDDPVPHALTLAVGLILALVLIGVW